MEVYDKISLKKEEKRLNLLNAAYEIFNQKNFNDVTISEITNKAKVAKGTFYLYFKDKYDLRNELIVSKARELLYDTFEKVDISSKNDVCSALLEFSSVIIDRLSENPFIVEFLAKNLSWGMFLVGVEEIIQENELDYKNLLAGLFERSSVTYKNPEHMLFFIIEFLGAASYSPILYQEPASINEMKPEILEIIKGIINANEE